MTVVRAERLTFTFDARVDVFQYESGGVTVAAWPPGAKVVDVVGNDARTPTVWLIEAKDFRVITAAPRPAQVSDLAITVNGKCRQTLSSLAVVARGVPSSASTHAAAALAIGSQRVVLHLEPHPPGGVHSRLFPSSFAANVLMKLRQLVRDLDVSPLVLDIQHTPAAGVPWSVS